MALGMALLGIGGAMSIAGSLFGGISGYSSSKKAAKQAKKVGRIRSEELMRQAQNEEEFNLASEKSLIDEQARRRSMIEGMYSKSGLLLTGTPATAIQEQTEADTYNLQQTSRAGAERVRSLNQAAKMESMMANSSANAYKTEGRTALIGGLFGAGQALGSMSGWMGQSNPPPPAGGGGGAPALAPNGKPMSMKPISWQQQLNGLMRGK